MKTNWKAFICALLCLAVMLTPVGCKKSGKTSSTDTQSDMEYGDPAKCTLCPDKNRCCFCYEYGDCVCASGTNTDNSNASGGGETSNGSKNSGTSGNRRPSQESSSSKYDSKNLKGKTITILRSWDPYVSGNNTAHDNWIKRVAELEKKYNFDIVEKKWSSTLETEVLAGVKPSGQLYQVQGDNVANLVRAGYIASLNKAMKETGIDMTSEIYCDFSVQLCNYNHNQYAIGVEEGKMMSQIVYNKKLVSQFADIEALMDQGKWTWSAMTDIATKVKQKYPDKWGIGLDKHLSVYGMVASNGSQLVSVGSDGSLSSNLNDAKVRQALDQLYSWINVDKVATTGSWDNMLTELTKSNIAFTFNEDYCYDVLKSRMNADEYGIAYLPMGPSAKEYYALMEASWPYVVPKAYENEAADLLFVVNELYKLQHGYSKDDQFRDLYVRKFSEQKSYNRVKNMHRTLKCAPIIEIELGDNASFASAITQLYENKISVGQLIDSYHSEFDMHMKDNWKNIKFTGKIK